jgi:predicted DsbA family dithiol-disulfide isomerase
MCRIVFQEIALNIDIISDVVCPRCYVGKCLIEAARAIGVEGVPFFIFNGKLAVSGAQGPAALLDAMHQAETAVA